MTTATLPPTTRRRVNTMVMLCTVVTASFALALAVVLVGNAADGWPRDRTIPAVVLMGLGFVGPLVGGRTVRRWWRRTRGVALPALFVFGWTVAAVVHAVSPEGTWKPVVPFTPTFTVRYEADGRPHFATRGPFGGSEDQRGESRVNGIVLDDVTVAYRVHPDAAGARAIAFEGSASPPDRRPLEARGTLTLAGPTRVHVEGLADATLLIDDRPTAFPVVLEAGSYQIVVRGSPVP